MVLPSIGIGCDASWRYHLFLVDFEVAACGRVRMEPNTAGTELHDYDLFLRDRRSSFGNYVEEIVASR